jgi:hypothetical protein
MYPEKEPRAVFPFPSAADVQPKEERATYPTATLSMEITFELPRVEAASNPIAVLLLTTEQVV